ncbi:MAG: HAD hydrolase-like protein [Beijerinckiaceae bacterium]|nr:HAD hydrolase-like protein [Beijerinckiaceae bacterium]MCZ8300699.1 HAD hydrolase-like protein [Beijerinckiaceae bacterium]
MSLASFDSLALFDFDGTLVDTAPWFFRTINTVAERHRFRAVTSEEGEILRDLPPRMILRRLGIPVWKLPAIAADMRRRVLADDAAMPLFPWVPDLLARLSAGGCRIGIVSSNSETAIRGKLGPALAHVHRISAGASLFGKPAHLRRVLKGTGLPAARTTVIGDEIRDIEAARKIGARSVAVTWGLGGQRGLAGAGPDLLIHRAEDLVEALLTRA